MANSDHISASWLQSMETPAGLLELWEDTVGQVQQLYSVLPAVGASRMQDVPQHLQADGP